MAERIFYCPKHGRVTDEQYKKLGSYTEQWFCEHCAQWYYRFARFKAKRGGES